MTDPNAYLLDLTTALIRRGLEPDRAADATAEVGAHLRDSGLEPEAEFGSAETYAEALVTAGPGDVDPTGTRAAPPATETYTFRATALDEVAVLADLGRDGWELTGVREFGLIAQRPTDPARRRTWEYARRNAVRHQAVVQEMAAHGWQPCGRWVTFHYFKRPAAAPAPRSSAVATP